MARAVGFEQLRQALLRRLALTGPAPRSRADASARHQPVGFSRLVASMRRKLLVVGRARKTRYAAYRSIADVGSQIPVYEIDERGRSRRLIRLHAILPEGFYVEGLTGDVPSRFYKDLPYFLGDLRPAGFLGRLIPRQESEAPGSAMLPPTGTCLVSCVRAERAGKGSTKRLTWDDAVLTDALELTAIRQGPELPVSAGILALVAGDAFAATEGCVQDAGARTSVRCSSLTGRPDKPGRFTSDPAAI